jgi:hypothetical protein
MKDILADLDRLKQETYYGNTQAFADLLAQVRSALANERRPCRAARSTIRRRSPSASIPASIPSDDEKDLALRSTTPTSIPKEGPTLSFGSAPSSNGGPR